MISGKRRRVRAIFDQTFHRSARSSGDVIELLVKAVENIKPICEVEKVKIAGTTYDVPSIVGRDRQQSLAIRWILEGAEEGRISKSTSLEKSSFEEIVDAYRQKGISHMKRHNLHRLASVKRRFVHFRRPPPFMGGGAILNSNQPSSFHYSLVMQYFRNTLLGIPFGS
uniref:ribosomal protein S7 n=1 Tax=Phyllospadix iwatensis TaxID=214525 RepID=UPI00226C7615|nr:ribosomal protein S7 [Phyllospadix iwatensis]UZH94084.1 ribosomal protein S7 [Phyllospadix iwatensis]